MHDLRFYFLFKEKESPHHITLILIGPDKTNPSWFISPTRSHIQMFSLVQPSRHPKHAKWKSRHAVPCCWANTGGSKSKVCSIDNCLFFSLPPALCCQRWSIYWLCQQYCLVLFSNAEGDMLLGQSNFCLTLSPFVRWNPIRSTPFWAVLHHSYFIIWNQTSDCCLWRKFTFVFLWRCSKMKIW
jgi:uncharacterized protein YbdZ (MbtH family)